jgi:tetratricopeptide (TPR) repeat protein
MRHLSVARRRVFFAACSLVILGLGLYFFLPALRPNTPAARSVVPALQFAASKGPLVFPKPAAPLTQQDEPNFEDFAGSEACAKCHAKEYEVWRSSTHGRAGGLPKTQNVIGGFNGKALRYQDGEVIPSVKDREHYAFAVKQKGFAEQVIEVAAVIGGGHLYGGGTQSYFAEFPDGTLRFLPFDYSRHSQTWFSQRREDNAWVPVSPALALEGLQEWPPSRVLGATQDFSNCQNCHASQLLVHYDLPQRRYVTRYKSLDINCESCHGPGKRHVELAQPERVQDAADLGMKPLAALPKDESLQICWQCHAVKNALAPDYLPGKNFENYFSVNLPILADNPHLADGRIRSFAYQQNHLYSDCYLNGSLTCADCHDPHSLNYRDIYGRELAGRFDNQQCLDCHASKAQRLEAHTHHRPNSPGSACVACHMPYLQHRGIGTQIQFTRSDHSIAIPRPEFDAKLGIENACEKCHAQKGLAWLEAKTQEWYGALKPHKAPVTGLLQVETLTDRQAAAELLLQPKANHAMAQYAGLSYFVNQFLQPDMAGLESEVVEKLKTLCREPNLDLRALAMMSLHLALGRQAEIRAFLIEILKNSGAHETALRTRWALALDYLGTRYVEKGDYGKAITVHQKGLEVNPDDPLTLVNLGIAYGSQGDLAQAIAAFYAALALEPANAKAFVNLAAAYSRLGNLAQAIAAYQQAVQLQPNDPATPLLLAQTYLENGQPEQAKAALRAGLARMPYDRQLQWLLQQVEPIHVNQN